MAAGPPWLPPHSARQAVTAAGLRAWGSGLCLAGACGGGCSIASGWEAWYRKAGVTPDSLFRQGWGWPVTHPKGHSHLHNNPGSGLSAQSLTLPLLPGPSA